ncbi:L-aspartate oxidase [Kaistia geumhonensis]|uniref:L-aspartate oxidase n=1 Tax=Kaistia geumhonensis TaxID=410839 RepID=A0ABU0M1H4_9HYPH|nr:L-aspartate oxidase [Kaistia geumhonensis]MCX5479971.1 L-aspartate oxidase [Kaistia geumhonensis]MDQ0514801.1 L-aspartate oxidase [Kaistia geumhonensis]
MTPDLRDLAGRPVIVGAGLAGLATALFLAPRPVVLVTKAPLGAEASSPWAQGGMAAAMGGDDHPTLHAEDTIAAGDGLCDEATVRRIVDAAPAAIAALARFGVGFDRHTDGGFRLGLEAAHGRNRIVHAEGDGTGREIVRALVAAVRATPSIACLEQAEIRRLLTDAHGSVAGVLIARSEGVAVLPTRRVVLATGGIGGLYEESTNPRGCFGQGLVLAARAGAVIADPEFVQFHPTAFASAARPMRLVSEAVRGEGAALVDEAGHRFLAAEPGAELAPRDIVARAIWRQIEAGHRVFLDARERPGNGFARRFPSIAAICRAEGVDPERDPIPVRPAAHYHMGGVAVDADGQSTVEGLWAAGEVASTGLHGANRLASNSLTEAVVLAAAVAASIEARPAPAEGRFMPAAAAPLPPDNPGPIRPILARHAGVLRDADGFRQAVRDLLPLASGRTATADPALAALLVAVGAYRRRESRGAHFRSDHPARETFPRRTFLTLDTVMSAASEIVESNLPAARIA